MPIRKSPDLLSDLQEPSKSRLIIGTCLNDDAISLDNLTPLNLPAALILGPEDFGITAETQALCHHLIIIPMHQEMDSLNVASSSAIFLDALR